MTNQGFEKVTTGLEALKNYTIVYNGFIDKDLYTDLIVRSRDKKTLKFFLYNNDKGIFEEKVNEFQASGGEEILSVKSVKILQGSQWSDLVIITYNKNTGDYETILRGYKFVAAGAGGAFELNPIDSYNFKVSNT